MSHSVDATVVIVTYNRKDDLRKAVASALEQSGNVEVLVLDDASTDGTDQMMRDEFPTARYDRAEKNLGHIAHRNRAADLARSPYLVSIDDDAVFSTTDVVQQTLRDFDDPRIGAVAIPYIDVKKGDEVLQSAPDEADRWAVSTFRGTAYALRKDVFNQTGRYRASFRHSAEEVDFSMRMLNEGYAVRLGRSDPIHHFESPQRIPSYKFERMCRNALIYVMLNYPVIDVLPHLVGKSVNCLRSGVRKRMTWSAVKGMTSGLTYGLTHLSDRSPLDRERFLVFLRLWRGDPLPLDEVLPVTR